VTVTLRPVEEGDLDAMVVIERASFSDPWSRASFASMCAHPHAIARALVRDGLLLGYTVAWMVGDEAELANIAVAADARGGGLGGLLLDDLLGEIARRGGATVYLEVRAGNVAAQALYASRGFVARGLRRGYYAAPVEDAVIMRRDRPPGAPPND